MQFDSIIINKLPGDIKNFLADNLQRLMFGRSYDANNCDCGKVVLNSIADLSLIHVFQNTGSSSLFYSRYSQYCGQNQFYGGVAIDLLKKTENYQPKGVLVYIPDFKSYATWDNDHDDLYFFRNISWDYIQKDPLYYLNFQWRADQEQKLAAQAGIWENWKLTNKP